MKLWFYRNRPSLKFQACIGLDENENHKQHEEDKVEDSTNDESNNSSKKTNIKLQPNDKVLYFLLILVYIQVLLNPLEGLIQNKLAVEIL